MGYRSMIVHKSFWISVLASSTFSAPSYPKFSGCEDLTDANFTVTTLVSNATNPETSEPLKMAFDMDAVGNVDVYFVQRFGLLRKYKASTKSMVNLGKFTVPTGSSDGLIGIALDPLFKTNRWIYLYYSTSTDWRVGRFTLNGEQLDMTSEKVVITIPESAGSQHTGGALQFDWEGNLWITTGDNNKSTSAANTFDLRGKILRIKPTADGKFTVPSGNLFAPGLDKTRPEIYVMGARNPYSLSLDAGRKAVTWGDVGPDFGGISEEHNFTTKPGNFGWPYYAGDNIKLGGGGSAEAPVNSDGGNTGIANLPPAIAAIDSYKQACSLTGPVFYYNTMANFPGKLPPHFDGKWLVSEFSRNVIVAMSLNPAGTQVLARDTVFSAIKIKGPLDFQAGPDGNLYIMNYAGYRSTSDVTGLLKISYNGACNPLPNSVAIYNQGNRITAMVQEIRGSRVSIVTMGKYLLEVQDLSGRIMARYSGRDKATYDLAGTERTGIYFLRISTSQGTVTAKLAIP
jgi:glucose/arabinose dehydrogenase